MFKLGLCWHKWPETCFGAEGAIRLTQFENSSSSEAARLTSDICKKWSSGPSILVRSQYFIFPHFSERGKYDSLIDCCINVLPGDERRGVLCFYVIRLTSSWEWALCSAPTPLQCQGACDGHLERLVLLCVLFVSRYYPRHFIDQNIYIFIFSVKYPAVKLERIVL